MCVVRPSRNAAGRGLGGGSSRGQCPLTSRDSFSEESPNEPRVSIRPITDEARRLFFLTPPPATPAPPHPRFRPTPRNLLTIHIIINFIYFFCPPNVKTDSNVSKNIVSQHLAIQLKLLSLLNASLIFQPLSIFLYDKHYFKCDNRKTAPSIY